MRLISSNAISYNDQNTVYYHAAQKLTTVADFVLGPENISFLLRSLPFVKTLTLKSLGVNVDKSDERKIAHMPSSMKLESLFP